MLEALPPSLQAVEYFLFQLPIKSSVISNHECRNSYRDNFRKLIDQNLHPRFLSFQCILHELLIVSYCIKRYTIEPTASSNYQSPQEKFISPSFPGSRQGKAKSGFFPRLLPRKFFFPVFEDILMVLPIPGFHQAFFPGAVTRNFFR